jgi:iron(III) transport system permease protein
MNWALLQNSVIVAGSASVLAVCLGFLVALRIACSPPGVRRWLLAAAIATLALPPFLVVNHWLELFGAGGALRRWLTVPLVSLGGTVGVLTIMFWPIATLLALGAWDRLEPAQWEADPCLRGPALVRWILWPAAGRSLIMAGVLIFVLAFNQFAIPVILQVPVFSEELWLALTARLDSSGAWVAAWPMILVPAALTLLLGWRRGDVPWPRLITSPVHSFHSSLGRQLGRGWRWATTTVTALVLLLGIVLPLDQLVLPLRNWVEVVGLLKSSSPVIANSVVLAVTAATVCTGLGLLLMRRSTGVFTWATWLLFFTPGVLLARSAITMFGRTALAGTLTVVVIVFALRYLALGWSGATLAWQAIDAQLLEVGRLEGARPWALLRHYAWPQLARPLAAVWYVVYLLSLWDVETLVLIYPPGGETLALRVFHLLHYGHNAQVNGMCLLLVGLALAPLVLWWLGSRVTLLARPAVLR